MRWEIIWENIPDCSILSLHRANLANVDQYVIINQIIRNMPVFYVMDTKH